MVNPYTNLIEGLKFVFDASNTTCHMCIPLSFDVGSEFVEAGSGAACSLSPKPLSSLRILEIKNYGDGVFRSLIRVASSVTKLSIEGISGLTDEVFSISSKDMPQLYIVVTCLP